MNLIINDCLYFYLKDRISPLVQLRYPFQDTSIDLKNGYVSWQVINSRPLSTQSPYIYENKKNCQQFINNMFVYAESVSANSNTLDLIQKIQILLNSSDFLRFCKNENFQIYSMRSNSGIVIDNYFHDTKVWVTKCSLEFEFVNVNSIEIDEQKHISNVTVNINYV